MIVMATTTRVAWATLAMMTAVEIAVALVKVPVQ